MTDTIESADDVRAWAIWDDAAEDDLDGILLCPGCVGTYLGDGDPTPVAHEAMLAGAYCHECDTYLGDEPAGTEGNDGA